MLTVVCFLWRTPDGRHNHLYEYDADYVNKLRSMLGRHLSLAHELVCVTDIPEGIHPGVRIVPTPVEVRDWPGMLRRLVIFREDAPELLQQRRLILSERFPAQTGDGGLFGVGAQKHNHDAYANASSGNACGRCYRRCRRYTFSAVRLTVKVVLVCAIALFLITLFWPLPGRARLPH